MEKDSENYQMIPKMIKPDQSNKETSGILRNSCTLYVFIKHLIWFASWKM